MFHDCSQLLSGDGRIAVPKTRINDSPPAVVGVQRTVVGVQ
jgi:hypothetical protein